MKFETLQKFDVSTRPEDCLNNPSETLDSLAWHLAPNLRDWRETQWFDDWLRLARHEK